MLPILLALFVEPSVHLPMVDRESSAGEPRSEPMRVRVRCCRRPPGRRPPLRPCCLWILGKDAQGLLRREEDSPKRSRLWTSVSQAAAEAAAFRSGLDLLELTLAFGQARHHPGEFALQVANPAGGPPPASRLPPPNNPIPSSPHSCCCRGSVAKNSISLPIRLPGPEIVEFERLVHRKTTKGTKTVG